MIESPLNDARNTSVRHQPHQNMYKNLTYFCDMLKKTKKVNKYERQT